MPFSGGSGGDGTSGNPYQLANLTDLQSWDDNWLSVVNKYFILTANIDATATSGWNAGAGWIPVGTSANKFTGNFNGNGKTITGIFINRTSSYVGFWGSISGATVSSLGLISVDITSSGSINYNYIGGFAGEMGTPNVSKCYSTGIVSGSGSYTGGFCGNSANVLSNCYSTCNVNGNSYVGGFIGYNSYTLTNCYSIGSVSGTSNVGGFCGFNGNTITNCFWDTQTSGQATSAGGTGKTTAEMKLAATFTSWNFSTIWDIIPTVSYPTLEVFGNTHSIASLLPITGNIAGGTSITLTGTGFIEGATNYAVSATVGGSAATDFVVVSNTSATCTTPAHAAGLVNVVLTFLDTGTSTLTNGFTYVSTPDPAISSIVPAYGTTAGGTRVVISGAGFTGATAVKFRSVDAYSYEVVSDSTINAITPVGTKGVCDVDVTVP